MSDAIAPEKIEKSLPDKKPEQQPDHPLGFKALKAVHDHGIAGITLADTHHKGLHPSEHGHAIKALKQAAGHFHKMCGHCSKAAESHYGDHFHLIQAIPGTDLLVSGPPMGQEGEGKSLDAKAPAAPAVEKKADDVQAKQLALLERMLQRIDSLEGKVSKAATTAPPPSRDPLAEAIERKRLADEQERIAQERAFAAKWQEFADEFYRRTGKEI